MNSRMILEGLRIIGVSGLENENLAVVGLG